jgi:hypothetical protein
MATIHVEWKNSHTVLIPVMQHTMTIIKVPKLKQTVKFTLEQAIKAQRGNRCIVSFFL